MFKINPTTNKLDLTLSDAEVTALVADTYCPYIGATTTLNLGSQNFITTGTLGAGAITGTSFIIGANTLTTSEWAFLDGQDQAVKTTSSPTFANVVLPGNGAIYGSYSDPLNRTALKIYVDAGMYGNTGYLVFDGTSDGSGNLSNSIYVDTQSNWINFPTTTSGGIGTGGYGTSPWIAYASAINNWFTGSAIGDVAYRNLSGKLLFGTSSGAPQLAITTTGIGIGQITPTAVLHLKAGTATASTAPLKLTAGVITTVAVSGQLETDASNNLYYTNAVPTRGQIPLATAANTLFFTTTGATNVTLPTAGTLAILGANSFVGDQTLTSTYKTIYNASTEYINSANAGYLDLNATTGIRLNQNTIILDAKWIGLGTGKGLIQFNDGTIDTISFLNARVGIGASTLYSALTVGSGGYTGDYAANGILINPASNEEAALVMLSTSGTGSAIYMGGSNTVQGRLSYNNSIGSAWEFWYAWDSSQSRSFAVGPNKVTVDSQILGGLIPYTTPSASVDTGGSIPNGTYHYVVTAIDYMDEEQAGTTSSADSNEVTTTTGNNTVNITWTARTGAKSYKIYRLTSAQSVWDEPADVYLGTSSTNSYTDTAATTSAGTYPAYTHSGLANGINNNGTSWLGTGGLNILLGNVCIGTTSSETGSVGVLNIANKTAPDAHVDNQIQIYSVDSSDNTATLGLYLEQAVEDIGTFTASHKIKVKINGTEYWLQLDAV